MRRGFPPLAWLVGFGLSVGADDYKPHSFAAPTLPATANGHYQLLAPKNPRSADRWPLVVYLHGAGSKGDDNRKPATEPFPKVIAAAEVRIRFPAFVLLPQCRDGTDAAGRPNNWVKWVGQKDHPPAEWTTSEPEMSDQLVGAGLAVADVLAKHPIDPRRVYLVGVSMGGSGSLYWAAREPSRFAGVVAACGLSETAKASMLAKTPLWLFHGSDDPVAPVSRSRDVVAAVKAAGGAVTFTEYTGAGHGIAARVFSQDDYAALNWLFSQVHAGEAK